jgi:hypothetical protein
MGMDELFPVTQQEVDHLMNSFLPTDKQARKETPIVSGVLDYFPDAIAEVARVSFTGNQQHNPGQPLHWDRTKSMDHVDCIGRHLLERGTLDTDGRRHSGKLAWRALALCQLEIEAARASEQSLQAEANRIAAMPPDEYAEARTNALADVYVLNVTTADVIDEIPVELSTMNFTGETGDFEYDEAVKNATVPQDSAWQPEEVPAGAGPFCELMYRDLLRLHVPVEVASHISQGTKFASPNGIEQKFVYVAGPMRGYEHFNFPAFDVARDELVLDGWNAISPADIDRASDSVVQPTPVYFHRDVLSLYYIAKETVGGAIAMLPGWERSTGATAEFFAARWLGLKVLDADTGELLLPTDVDLVALGKSVLNFLMEQLEKEEG